LQLGGCLVKVMGFPVSGLRFTVSGIEDQGSGYGFRKIGGGVGLSSVSGIYVVVNGLPLADVSYGAGVFCKGFVRGQKLDALFVGLRGHYSIKWIAVQVR